MSQTQDPTEEICQKAMTYPEVVKGMSCNQASFKAKAAKRKFLFIGPGAKGIGFKAMFKLDDSAPQARKLAEKEPDRYNMGAGPGWVTVRFSADQPLPKSIWEKWLQESYDLSCS